MPQTGRIVEAARASDAEDLTVGKFLMPSLGADMEAGTLVEWEKKPGDPVRHGDIVAVVETQKGAIEIEAFEDGVLDSYLVEIGRKVPVGTPLAVIRGENEPPGGIPEEPSPAGRAAEDLPLAETEASAEFRASDAPAVAAAVRTRSTPAARRAAAAAGIDLASLRGTGPGGAIVLEDVVASVPSAGDGRKPGSARHVEEGGPGSTRISKRAQRRSISLPCARRSPPPWPGRSARFRITIFPIRSN